MESEEHFSHKNCKKMTAPSIGAVNLYIQC